MASRLQHFIPDEFTNLKSKENEERSFVDKRSLNFQNIVLPKNHLSEVHI